MAWALTRKDPLIPSMDTFTVSACSVDPSISPSSLGGLQPGTKVAVVIEGATREGIIVSIQNLEVSAHYVV